MNKPGYLTSIVLLVGILTACATPTRISPTNVPTQALISGKSMIRPGDKIGEMTIVSESIFNHRWVVEFCEFDFETSLPTQTTDCTVTNLDTLALVMGLSVAADKLAANWDAKTWELEIDGYPVELEAFGWDDMPYSDTSGAGISRG